MALDATEHIQLNEYYIQNHLTLNFFIKSLMLKEDSHCPSVAKPACIPCTTESYENQGTFNEKDPSYSNV